MSKALRKPGWWYPYIFVGMFGVIIVVNGIMAYFAVSSFSGLSTTDAYEKGRLYNQAIAAAEQQKALGWTATFTAKALFPEGTPFEANVNLVIKDANGQPVPGLAINATIIRPLGEAASVVTALHHSGDGIYSADVTLPLRGNWTIEAVAYGQTETFQITEKFFVK